MMKIMMRGVWTRGEEVYLAGGIPQLESHRPVIDIKSLGQEINPNSGLRKEG